MNEEARLESSQGKTVTLPPEAAAMRNHVGLSVEEPPDTDDPLRWTERSETSKMTEADEAQRLLVGAEGLEADSMDILHEMYWYVIKDREETVETLKIEHVLDTLLEEGILFWRDARYEESQNVALALAGCSRTIFTKKIPAAAQAAAAAVHITYDGFVQFVRPCARLFLKVWSEENVIPDWTLFITDMTYHFYEVESHHEGQTAQYIPILRDAHPHHWGLSICSIDGQRFSIGDALVKHSLQSVSKPVTYALGLAREGREFMEQWIGCEPAGRPFNTQDLEPGTNRPFNASVNSGAIMAAGVFASALEDYTWREIVDQVRGAWFDLCGNDLEIGFSQETYESEKLCAYINFAIAYNLKGRRGLPRDVDLHKMLDVYLGCCSIEITCEALAVAAATLANGGVCPITGKEIFPAHVTRTVLSEIMMAGMYDGAGMFAVEVGLPAKSGVSGALMVIVPNVFGYATYSPRLNEKGNSVRGIEFCKRLVASYRVHVFEPLRSGNTGAKIDPRQNGWKNERTHIARQAWAVEVGDRYALRLRDIFLFALCQTALSSPEGLSERMLEVIRENYEQVYQLPADEKLLQDVIDAVKQHPSELRYLEQLTKGVDIPDSMRSIIILAILDVIMIDGSVDEIEKNVALRIAVMLGIDREVALLELNRYEQNVGHRLKEMEFCDMIEVLDVSHHKRSLSMSRHGRHIGAGLIATAENLLEIPTSRHNKSSNPNTKHGQTLRTAIGNYVGDKDEQGDVVLLRKEVSRLRRKVDKLTSLLHKRG